MKILTTTTKKKNKQKKKPTNKQTNNNKKTKQNKKQQLLQLHTARTVSLVRCGNKAHTFRSVPVNYPDGGPASKPRVIHQQNPYNSVVLTEDTGVIRGLLTDGDQ